MKKLSRVALVIGLVLLFSAISVRMTAPKPETGPAQKTLVLRMDMTAAQFGEENGFPNPMLKKLFDLQSKQDLQKPLNAWGLTPEQIRAKAAGLSALQAEHSSKNWQKILIKFGLWIAWLAVMFGLLRRGTVTSANRPWLLLVPVVVFGVLLGADPNPMGTVKDAIALYAKEGVIFPPRLIAFGVFMLLAILANKLICSWGCQFGTLQDMLFQIMHGRKGSTGFKPIKLPFVLTNTVRILFLLIFTGVVFATGFDFIEGLDPFKIFKPQAIGWMGGIFVGLLLVTSLWVYRPWCHLFCPFGLVGWLGEKISLFKIRIDRDACIDCKACVKACPSKVMESYLENKKPAPDCFSCAACIETCPTKAIDFSHKRPAPKQS